MTLTITLLGTGSPMPSPDCAGVGTLVLTHDVPPLVRDGEEAWRHLAAGHFDGRIEIGPDLHRVEVGPATSPTKPITAGARSN